MKLIVPEVIEVANLNNLFLISDKKPIATTKYSHIPSNESFSPAKVSILLRIFTKITDTGMKIMLLQRKKKYSYNDRL